MTRDQFRALALALPETVESEHMGHPDFRVRGKVFATLGPAGAESGMVKLTAEQQAAFMRGEPDVFQPCSGAWGRGGATSVRLGAASAVTLRQAVIAAWRNTAPEGLGQSFRGE